MIKAEGVPTGWRHIAIQAARAGAAVCLRNFGVVTDAVTKGQAGNLVTAVDAEAEDVVRASIRTTRPADAVYGEELDLVAGQSDYLWVIDPLDGTTNFTRRIPIFGTSVAVQRVSDGQWLAGAVCAPALGQLWSAGAGGGAELVILGAEPQRLPLGIARSSARLLGTGLSYSQDRRDEQIGLLAETMRGYTDLRRMGAAAIDLCLLAQGSLDTFSEDDLGVYDWAAGALIAEEAGARVRRPTDQGGPIWASWA